MSSSPLAFSASSCIEHPAVGEPTRRRLGRVRGVRHADTGGDAEQASGRNYRYLSPRSGEPFSCWHQQTQRRVMGGAVSVGGRFGNRFGRLGQGMSTPGRIGSSTTAVPSTCTGR
jgi:hypothetical protein